MSRLTFLVTVITLTCSGVILASGVKSQNLKEIRVNVDPQHTVLREILTDLDKKSEFNFVYSQEMGNVSGIRLSAKTSTLYDILKEISQQKKLRFNQENFLIAVVKSPELPKPPPGSVKGRIVEFETTQPLPGASVYIVELKKGIQSDNNGYYEFANIPPGKYTLQISYVSYSSQKVLIEIKEGKEVRYDVKLKGSNSLNEVVVTSRTARTKAPVSHSSDQEVLTEIKNSRGIVSGISNEQIVKSADRNAAEIVRRISGVTVVDDKFIVVRGMQSRYNLTYLNDNLAPSTEVYNRSFAYDMLPSPVVDKILVYKSPSAELLGDFAGGAVKIFTKNTKPVRHFDAGIQLGYREGTTFKNMNSGPKSSTDWLGFDNGLRKLPSNIPSYRESGGKYAMSQQELVTSFSDDWTYGQQKALPDMQVFLNYFDSKRLGKWRLYNLSSLTYTNENRHIQQDRQVGNTYAYRLDKYGFNLGAANTIGQNDQSVQQAKLNLLQNFTLKIDSLNRIEWKNFFMNEGRNTVSVQINQPNTHPSLSAFENYQETKQNTLQFQQRLLYNSNLGGYHTSSTKLAQQLRWNLGYAYSLQDIPDQRTSRFARQYSPKSFGSAEDADLRWITDYGLGQSQLFYGMMNRFFVKNSENTYNASADYSIQVSPELLMKAGTYHLFRDRSVDRHFFKVNRGGLTGNEFTLAFTPGGWDNSGRIDPNLLTFREQDLGQIWQPANFKEDGSGLQLYDMSSPIDHYIASEQNNSAYIQGEWTGLEKRVTLQAGVRFEHHLQQVSGALDVFDVFLPVHVELEQNKFLPSLQLNYRPNQKWVLRSSYGRTVNRPELREIAPFSDFDFINQERITGNVLLKGSVIDNYDFRVELYPGSTGNETISAGAFYKELDKPIERLRFANGHEDFGGQTGISYFNADRAQIYGLELELRKNLGFIPGAFFRNVSLVANGALIKSKSSRTTMPTSDNLLIVTIPGYKAGLFKDRPLQGQAPYVLSSGLYYENPSWGTKIGVLYNVSGPSIYAIADGNAEEILQLREKTDGYSNQDLVTLATGPDLLELPRHQLDLSFTQRLYKSLQMRLNIQNLLNQSVRIVEDQNFNHKYDREIQTPAVQKINNYNDLQYYKGDNIFLEYNTGRYGSVAFTYSF